TALSLFTQVYNKDKNNIEANNNLGKAYLLKEDYSNAVTFYQNALKLDSKNNAIRANLAKAYAQSGEYDYAKSTYTELLKTDKENWDAYIELAKVCMQLSDNANAEAYLIYVQEKNPGYRKAEVAGLLQSITE
ncbi:MAG: tetratricopeptide repeat protein, partial [Treponema sp.]|nr:tetratricopeptide repeat protein [Treponema sp.]